MILNVKNLSHGFGDRAIFNNVSFRLLKGEHIGLIGANGEGKSTFMNIITGHLMPDEGTVEWAKNVRVGYLDQHAVLEKGMTIRDVLKSAFQFLFELEENMVTMVSVDGYRLALRRERANVGKTMSFIVPGKTLGDLLKLLDDSDDPVGIQVSKKHILFEIGNCVVVSRLLEGEFLNYKTSIPQSGSTTVTIKTREFIDSI